MSSLAAARQQGESPEHVMGSCRRLQRGGTAARANRRNMSWAHVVVYREVARQLGRIAGTEFRTLARLTTPLLRQEGRDGVSDPGSGLEGREFEPQSQVVGSCGVTAECSTRNQENRTLSLVPAGRAHISAVGPVRTGRRLAPLRAKKDPGPFHTSWGRTGPRFLGNWTRNCKHFSCNASSAGIPVITCLTGGTGATPFYGNTVASFAGSGAAFHMPENDSLRHNTFACGLHRPSKQPGIGMRVFYVVKELEILRKSYLPVASVLCGDVFPEEGKVCADCFSTCCTEY
ncbi:hypothetical protein Bbelb_120450 [Branchiostoma belcheri]|nr:hypothetical protein Bbelb_120450 [Branchiostoma belcheri]